MAIKYRKVIKGVPEIQTPYADAMAEIDMVNHPPHYNSGFAECQCGRRIECIDITRNMGFCLGNAVKYIWRHADKNGLEDIKKAAWYLNDYIETHSK